MREGDFSLVIFEAVFPLKSNVPFCPDLLLKTITQKSRKKSLGAFKVAEVWKSRVTMIKPLSVINETPTYSDIRFVGIYTLFSVL